MNIITIIRSFFISSRIGKYYFIGLPKTGSKSVSEILSKYNAPHEYMFNETFENYLKYKEKRISRNDWYKFIKNRALTLNCKYDISPFNFYFIDFLKKNRYNKYIFPIRHPLSWMNSWINFAKFHVDNLKDSNQIPHYNRIIKFVFGEDCSYEYFKYGKILGRDLVEPLLSYWTEGMIMVLQNLPNNTLILNTNMKEYNLSLLINFLEMESQDIIAEKWISHVTPYRIDYFENDRLFINNKINEKTIEVLSILKEKNITDIEHFTSFIYYS